MLAQLVYEKGMIVLTASLAYQAAIETARLGAREWVDYVAARVPSRLSAAQPFVVGQ